MQIINSDIDKCIGCNHCVRECPAEVANVTYMDDNSDIKVKAVGEQCIACGACIAVCDHEARYYSDDTERFFDDLAAGKKLSVIAAPAIKTNFPEYKKLIALLRNMGVAHVYDVSLGADVCVWAHIRYIETNPRRPMITQPCPVIVSYIETYRPGLVKYLSPIQSPMACMAIYLRNYLKDDAHIAALSPCIAKTNEHLSTELIEYNITFKKLAEYIEKNALILPDEDVVFDGDDAGLGAMFPVPGGMSENIRFFMGDSLHIERVEGKSVYAALDEYASADPSVLPDLFDILNCAGACAAGTGCIEGQNIFDVSYRMNRTRMQKNDKAVIDRHRQRLEEYDQRLNLSDYTREYFPIADTMNEVSEKDIQKAFSMLGKDDFVKQNFNCGACGSISCREMARKIALGVNIPDSCIVKSRDDAKGEHIRIERYLTLADEMADSLFSQNEDSDVIDNAGAVHMALKDLYDSISDIDAVSIWRYIKSSPGSPDCADDFERLNYYFGESTISEKGIRGKWPVEWTDELKNGRVVYRYLDEVPLEVRRLFTEMYKTILLVPMVLHGEFWGFIITANRKRVLIADEDVAYIGVCGMFIASSIIEQSIVDKLRNARTEAEGANAAKSNFLFSVSHEMRTPLNAVIGMTNVARSAKRPEQVEHALDTIDDSSHHLLRLINDILDMTHIEAGNLELDEAEFDMNEMIAEEEVAVAIRAGEKGQRLSINISPEASGKFIGDGGKLARVIRILVNNAIKFTPEGGDIGLSIAVSPEMKGEGMICLRFEVSDTGIGIAEDQQERVFASFGQADQGITRKFAGSGLGLTISRGFVEKMGGRIYLSSELGKGSTFFFDLPFSRPETHSPDEELRASAPKDDEKISDLKKNMEKIRGMKILLVEDMEINREIVVALLEDSGVTIDEAENGRDAVDRYIASSGIYDAIIMDIMMPVMDGYTATREIRASGIEGAEDIPIIAMTANAFSEDVERGREAGMDAHLSKPISLADLLGTLGRYA